VKDTALSPFRAATSKTAQRAYLGTFLLVTASIAVLCISTIAYGLFYYNFVPQLSLERVVHLQFGCASSQPSSHLHSAAT
jgi:seipin